jgi:hypothetical protein
VSRPVSGILSTARYRADRWSSIYAVYLERLGGPPLPRFDLAPGGVCLAARVTPGAGALLPHRFTLTCGGRPEDVRPSAVCFLWHFPASHLDWPLASTLPWGVPTFLDQVTDVAAAAWPRPPGRLTVTTILAP